MAEACLMTVSAAGDPNTSIDSIAINGIGISFSEPVVLMVHQELVVRNDLGSVKMIVRDRAPG